MSAILSGDPPELESGTRTIPPMLDRLVRRAASRSLQTSATSPRATSPSISSRSRRFPRASPAPQRRQRRQSRPPPRPRADAGLGARRAMRCCRSGRRRHNDVMEAGTDWTGECRILPAAYVPPRPAHGRPLRAGWAEHRVAAGWEGRPSALFTGRVDGIGERPLSIDGQVEDVSSTGEVALLTNVRRGASFMDRGTLARCHSAAERRVRSWRMSAARAGAQTDSSPSCGSLRRRWRLEFPVGTCCATRQTGSKRHVSLPTERAWPFSSTPPTAVTIAATCPWSRCRARRAT